MNVALATFSSRNSPVLASEILYDSCAFPRHRDGLPLCASLNKEAISLCRACEIYFFSCALN